MILTWKNLSNKEREKNYRRQATKIQYIGSVYITP
jgi:hypothetical protein